MGRGRRLAIGAAGAILVVDEIQKAATGWAETVKRLWDEDRAGDLALQVVLLSSAALLV